jgi:hypothetical protein
MRLYLDESGDFAVPSTTSSHRVASVTALVVPDSVQARLVAALATFRQDLPLDAFSNGEPKGHLLSAERLAAFADLLGTLDRVHVVPVTLDLSYFTPQLGEEVRASISQRLHEYADEPGYEAVAAELHLLGRQVENASVPQVLRLMSYANCIREALQQAILFLSAGPFEASWERLRIVIDRVQVRPGSREERLFEFFLPAWLDGWSRRKPFAMIREIHTPDHLIEKRYGSAEGLDVGKMLRGNVVWQSSAQEDGLQAVDFAAFIVGQAVRELDDANGAATRFGSLMRSSPYGPARGPGLFGPIQDVPQEIRGKYVLLTEVMKRYKQ